MKNIVWYFVVGLLMTGLLISCSTRKEQDGSEYAYTCSLCGATMMSHRENARSLRDAVLIYSNSALPHCKHQWKAGISSAFPGALSDGSLVLVKQDNIYGAFILKEQTIIPEKVNYQWWYRKDGIGRLDENSPEVISGIGEYDVKKNPRTKISFGPFLVGWSGSAKGIGFIYYELNSGGKPLPSTTLISVTDKTSIKGVDAADPKWHYGASPSDK